MKADSREWISVDDDLPPDHWFGLIVTDVRPDKPVMALTADDSYRRNFPFADYFIGKWRCALLVTETLQEKAVVTHWLKADELFPVPPSGKV